MSKDRFVVPLLLLVLLLLPSAALAWPIEWIDEFGSPAPEVGTYGIDFFRGDVFTGGLTYGALPGQTNRGSADCWIRRTDGDGGEVWTTQFGTADWEEVGAVRVDGSGIYVDGATQGELSDQTAAGGADAFVARYDLHGNERWTVQFGTAEDDYAAGVVVDRSGVYVFGYTFGAFRGYRNRGSADLFLARFAKDGGLQWLRQFGGRGYEEAWAAMGDSEGIYIDGLTDGRLPGAEAVGGWDAFVALFTRDGERVWLRQFGTHDDDIGSGLAADGGGVYVSGQTWGAFPGFRNHGASDAFVRKLSSAGATIWTRQFGTDQDDAAAGATLLGGQVVAAGTTAGAFPRKTNLGADDVFLKAFDGTHGSPGRTLEFGTDGEDTVGWAWAAAGDLFVIGDTEGTFPGEENAGGFDSYLARIEWGGR